MINKVREEIADLITAHISSKEVTNLGIQNYRKALDIIRIECNALPITDVLRLEKNDVPRFLQHFLRALQARDRVLGDKRSGFLGAVILANMHVTPANDALERAAAYAATACDFRDQRNAEFVEPGSRTWKRFHKGYQEFTDRCLHNVRLFLKKAK